MDWVTALAYAGPPLALLGGAVGSTLGIAPAAAAGLAIISEDPAMRSKVLLLAALPMTQTFYGFIFMFMALSMLHGVELTPFKSFAVFSISLAVGFAQLFSAWMQGRVCRNTISLLIKTKGAILGMGILLAAYEELFGILGMAFGLMILMMVL